jgi:threonine synthase
VLTGHGLKDPDWAIAGAGKPVVLPPDPDLVAAELELSRR